MCWGKWNFAKEEKDSDVSEGGFDFLLYSSSA